MRDLISLGHFKDIVEWEGFEYVFNEINPDDLDTSDPKMQEVQEILRIVQEPIERLHHILEDLR